MNNVHSFYSYWGKLFPQSPTKKNQTKKNPQKNPPTTLQASNQGKCIAHAGHCNAPEIPCMKISHIPHHSPHLVKEKWLWEPRQ